MSNILSVFETVLLRGSK